MTNNQQNKPITLSWENINVHTPNFKDTIIGKLICCKKDVPGKQLINNGKFNSLKVFFSVTKNEINSNYIL